MTRQRPSGERRQSIAVRTRTDLKQRLEEVAEENGHSLGQEVELRLEASFEEKPISKLERYIKNRPGLTYMIGMAAPLELANQLGDVLLNVVRHAEDMEWTEIQAREAMASASRTVSFYLFWTGADEADAVPDFDGEVDPQARVRDLPPILAGYEIAREHLLHSSILAGGSLFEDVLNGVVTNAWTGDRKTVERVRAKEPDLTPEQRNVIMDAPGELLGEEETARLHREGKLKTVAPFWHQVLEARRRARKSSK